MADFTDAEDRKLKRLWRAKNADGKDQYPASEIGRLMHRSKGSVVGRAHRLKLPARDTPIIRFGSGPRPPQTPRVRRSTLPPLASEQATVGPPLAPVLAASKPPKPPPAPAPAATPRPATGDEPPCCWPIGEPGSRSFRFCGCVAEPGKPYCTEHAGLAYVKVRRRADHEEALA